MEDMLCIFNIQKFSIHDGRGIRTTVFFKGCPLHCKWCSNPESQAFGIQEDREVPLSGKMYTVNEVLSICLEDREFYLESGGGVTLSGGEVLSQARQAGELITKLKEEQIHVAIETSGYGDSVQFNEIAALADCLLYDLKHYDSEKHRQGTGFGNELILKNLKYAHSIGKDILIRLAIIPDYNDSLEDAVNFALLIKDIGSIPVQLLPFHQFGQNKYEKLGITYEYKNYRSLHNDDLADFRHVLKEQGIGCVITE